MALGVSQTAHAWKPTTHVYLADYAYEDVVDDGQVTFDLLDPDTGEKVRTLGPYKVSPELVEILRKNRP
ncbi:MAG: hypothetical protein CME91_00995 [Hyphomonadaceae bacterium]|nr:hypothetical protein [Hyphomonadaceae bacterium]MBA29097.1 hypothetical protein [Hyphomonadaceae bacterium]